MSILQLQSIIKSFGGNRVIDDISTTFSPGKISCLIGANGEGKTTLFNIISALIHPDGGRVLVDGHDITYLRPHRISHLGIGRLFQDIRIFEKMTLLENLMVAFHHQSGENPLNAWFRIGKIKKEEKKNYEKAVEMIQFVGLSNRMNSISENLSYGEKKLLAIARLLICKSKILLLDEPSSGVHEGLIEEIMKRIIKIANDGKTVIMIEHNLNVVYRFAHEVIFLSQGKIGAKGNAKTLLHSTKEGFFLESIFLQRD